MSLLFPLFLAGLGSLSLPLLLHLIRKTPQGKQVFSSLLFLEPTPPRLTRRSRLDQIVLLLMRLAVLALLVFAFARPFLRESASMAFSDLPGRRVALLIDLSASMRRTGLWEQVQKLAQAELDQINPQDQVALYVFDESWRTEVGFDGETSGAAHAKTIASRVKELQPGWRSGNLGSALAAVAGELEAGNDAEQSLLEPRIVLISDMSQGSRLESLESIDWPEKVRVVVRPVAAVGKTNAQARVLYDEASESPEFVRVRVNNSSDATQAEFQVGWTSTTSTNDKSSSSVSVYVPMGESRVVRVPRATSSDGAAILELRGDEHDFDNQYFVIPPTRSELQIGYLGTESFEEPAGLPYFLQLATSYDVTRSVKVSRKTSEQSWEASPGSLVPLVVVGAGATAADRDRIQDYVSQGGLALVVLVNSELAALVQQLVGGIESITRVDKPAGGFSLLGEIDFKHPLFAPFATPPYGDFTRIHFWQHYQVAFTKTTSSTDRNNVATSVPTVDVFPTVFARFDQGDPALFEQRLGKGRIVVFASSWKTSDSQFALSSKFVPWVAGLIDLAVGATEQRFDGVVGDNLPLPDRPTGTKLAVITPDRNRVEIRDGQSQFTQTDEPGIYTIEGADTMLRFAINVADAEANTAPLGLEQLERRGVRLGEEPTQSERLQRVRQQRDTELEGRQKIWRVLLFAALGLMIVETLWASRAERLSTEVPSPSGDQR